MTGLIVDGRQPLRDGGEVVIDAVDAGTLTSGNYSPVLERGIGLGLLRGDPHGRNRRCRSRFGAERSPRRSRRCPSFER